MKVRFGMPEAMVMFAIGMLWHNIIAASSIFGIAVFFGFCRFCLEYNEKSQREEATKQAVQQLNEQAGELGEALGSLFKVRKKSDTNLH
jgi:hypothetical protein